MSTPAVLEDNTWKDDAAAWIAEQARTGEQFDVNDLRAALRDAPRPGMYGGAFIAAAIRGVIVEVNQSRAKAKSSHGRRIVRWAGAPAVALRAVA